MLQLIRSRVTSIFVKVLFALLILSFAVWGIGDIFQGGFSGRAAVAVGNVEIGPVDILERFDRARQRLSRQIGQAIGVREAAQFGILDAVIEEAVVDGLYAAEADDLGLAISENTIKRAIADTPAFRDQLGQFSAAQFRQVLFGAGLSEEAFVRSLGRDLKREQITSAATAGAAPVAAVEEALFRYRLTRRVASTVSIPFASISDIPEPTEADLRAFHEANEEDFRIPETRTVTFVELSPEDLAEEILIPDEQLREEYDARLAQFTAAERRTIEQIFFADEDAARAAYDRIAAGEDYATVAEDTTGATAGTLTLGTLSRDDLPEPDLAEAAFALAEGGVSEPVQSALGWHVLRVTAIEAEAVRPFEEVKDEIRLDLARVEAIDAVYELSTDLEDALAGGATLEEAATQLRLQVRTVERIARDGTDGKGTRADGLPSTGRFLELAFDTDLGAPSLLGETSDQGYFVLRPDDVQESHIEPFESAREAVASAWRDDQRAQAARTLAEDLITAGQDGATLETAAASLGYAVSVTEPFTRTGDGLAGGYPQDLAAIAFETAIGALDVAESDNGVVVLRVDREVAPEDDERARERIAVELRRSLGGDIVAALQAALRDKHAVEINRGFIDATIQDQQ